MNVIENEKQADVTRNWIGKFKTSLDKAEEEGQDDGTLRYGLLCNSLEAMIKDLEGQLALYELKKTTHKKAALKSQNIMYITFDEFLDYAKQNSDEPHWSFKFLGHPVTHENNLLYLISMHDHILRFHSDEVLCIRDDQSLFTIMQKDFHNTFLW